MNYFREWISGLLEDPAARAALAFVLAVIAAFLADRLTTLVLRVAVRRTRTNFDDALVDALHRPIIVTVLLAGAWQALLLLHGLEPPIVERALAEGDTPLSGAAAEEHAVKLTLLFTRKVLFTIALLVWTFFGLRIGNSMLRGAADSKRVQLVQPTSFPLFNLASRLLLLGIVVYLAMKVWSVDATGWLASAGILGIIVGLAAQDSLSNLFAGASILADGPYKIGDYINLDTGERGRVTSIGLRSTRLMTRDDIEIIIPNSAMGRATIVNETGGPARAQRLRAAVGVAYGSDLELVQQELLGAAEDVDLVLPRPSPRVRFRAFGDSSLQWELLCWIPDAELRGRALHEVNLRIAARFDAAGVSIPFPQRVVHLHDHTAKKS